MCREKIMTLIYFKCPFYFLKIKAGNETLGCYFQQQIM